MLFSIALVGGIFKLTHSSPTQNQAVIPTLSTNNGTIAAIQNAIAEKDTDNDGLKDWEEALWGTDLSNKDSDGDDTPDGEEVLKNRDPAKKGPNDVLAKPETTKMGSPGTIEELTPTDIVARDLFSKYLAAKQDKTSLDSLTEEQIVASVLSRQKEISGKTRQYTEGELIILNDSGPPALREYGNKMGTIIKNNLRQEEAEIDILNNAIQKNDKKEIAKLTPIINNYKNVLEGSLKVGIPEKALQSHLKFVNAVSEVIFSLEAMGGVFEDPVTAVAYFSAYPKTMTELQSAFAGARDLFMRNNISFDSTKDIGNFYAHYADAIEYIQRELQKQNL